MLRTTRRAIVAGGAVMAALLAGPAAAQPPANYSDVPDQFRIEVGGFRVGSDSELTFNTTGGPRPPVNFEALNLPENATQAYIEAFWRPGRRHLVSLSWFRNNREGDPTTTQREFVWGDRVITAGATVRAKVNSHYLSGVYRFAVYKNDRFEIGPSLGIGYLTLDAGISGDLSVSGAGGGGTQPFDISRDLNQPTGDLGGYLYWWPAKRLLIRGEGRYILVKPENAEASVSEARAAALYHPWKNFGFGVQYTYSKFRYDRDVLSRELGGSLRYSGGQLVISSAF